MVPPNDGLFHLVGPTILFVFLSVKTFLVHTLFGGSTKRRLIQIIDGIMLGGSTTPRLLLYFRSKESSIILCLVVSPNRKLMFSIRHNII